LQAFTLNPYKVFGNTRSDYDMVAIRGGNPGSMFDRAMEEYGGMTKFVKKGQTVVVKPNIGWDATPERAANTNPELIGRIVKHCLAAGAKDVYVFDHTCNEWTKCYKNSEIEGAVKKAGGTMVMGNSKKYYQDIEISGGKKLKSASVHELILESDVFINVPVLKNHGGANMTVAMKNLMGIVWDRGYWHRNDLHQCIADFSTWRNPDLTIVDAYGVMKRNGPRGVSVDDVVTMKAQLIGNDMVALDTAAIKLFGKEPDEVKYVGLAEEAGVGSGDLSQLNIARIKI
jgi:uncharacterized protein (DUF362 family)